MDVKIRLSEEPTSTPKGLLTIGWFAAFAFLFMAVNSEPEWRLMAITIGLLIIGALVAVAVWLWRQSKYGSAWLEATAFTYGKRFEGFIATELPSVPTRPVTIRIRGYHPAYNNVL